jgi:SWIM zinc finger
MKVFQETTDWSNDRAVNHIYFLSDSKDKMYAYINREGQIDEVKTPYRFHVRGRKFKEIANTWGFKPRDQVEVESAGEQHKVPGSKGAVYTVTNDQGVWTCTCPASKWQKGDCKHVTSLKG